MIFIAKNHTCKIVEDSGWFEYTIENADGVNISSAYWESTEAACLKLANAFLATLPEVASPVRHKVVSKPDANMAMLENSTIVMVPLIHRFSVGAGSIVEVAGGVVSRVIVS